MYNSVWGKQAVHYGKGRLGSNQAAALHTTLLSLKQ